MKSFVAAHADDRLVRVFGVSSDDSPQEVRLLSTRIGDRPGIQKFVRFFPIPLDRGSVDRISGDSRLFCGIDHNQPAFGSVFSMGNPTERLQADEEMDLIGRFDCEISGVQEPRAHSWVCDACYLRSVGNGPHAPCLVAFGSRKVQGHIDRGRSVGLVDLRRILNGEADRDGEQDGSSVLMRLEGLERPELDWEGVTAVCEMEDSRDGLLCCGGITSNSITEKFCVATFDLQRLVHVASFRARGDSATMPASRVCLSPGSGQFAHTLFGGVGDTVAVWDLRSRLNPVQERHFQASLVCGKIWSMHQAQTSAHLFANCANSGSIVCFDLRGGTGALRSFQPHGSVAGDAWSGRILELDPDTFVSVNRSSRNGLAVWRPNGDTLNLHQGAYFGVAPIELPLQSRSGFVSEEENARAEFLLDDEQEYFWDFKLRFPDGSIANTSRRLLLCHGASIPCLADKKSSEFQVWDFVRAKSEQIRMLLLGIDCLVDAGDLFGLFLFFFSLGLPSHACLLAERLYSISDSRVLVSLVVQAVQAQSARSLPGVFVHAGLNALTEFIDSVPVVFDGVELLAMVKAHTFGPCFQHPDIDLSEAPRSFRDLADAALEKMLVERNLVPSSLVSGVDGGVVPADIFVLVLRMNFFHRVLRFGGKELKELRSQGSLTVNDLSSKGLKCLVEFAYQRKIQSCQLSTILPLIHIATVYGEDELLCRIWTLLRLNYEDIHQDFEISISPVAHLLREPSFDELRKWWYEKGLVTKTELGMMIVHAERFARLEEALLKQCQRIDSLESLVKSLIGSKGTSRDDEDEEEKEGE